MRLHLKLRTSLSLCALSLLVLMLLAQVRYDPPLIQHSREAVLKTDLRTIRDVIFNYTLDKQEPPALLAGSCGRWLPPKHSDGSDHAEAGWDAGFWRARSRGSSCESKFAR